MRAIFLIDDNGNYKVLVGEHIVASPAEAFAAGLTDPALLAQITNHTLGRGATTPDQGTSARIHTDASGTVFLKFLWSNNNEGQVVLKPGTPTP